MADTSLGKQVANYILKAPQPPTVHREVSINPAAGNPTQHLDVELSTCRVVVTKGVWRSSPSSSNNWYQAEVYDNAGDVLDSSMSWAEAGWQAELFDYLFNLHDIQVEATRRQVLADLGDRALD